MDNKILRVISNSQQKWKWVHKGTILTFIDGRWRWKTDSFLKSLSQEEVDLGDFSVLPYWKELSWWEAKNLPQFLERNGEYFNAKWNGFGGNWVCNLGFGWIEPVGYNVATKEDYINSIL